MKALGFRRQERLKRSRDFLSVIRGGKKVRGGDMSLYYLVASRRPPGAAHPRLGITISRKAVRRAHDRNRIKRLIRESFRLEKAKIQAGADLVVQVHRFPKENSMQAVRRVWMALAGTARVVKSE